MFPALPGQGWSVHKRPTFSSRVASHVSGREVRAPFYAYPLYEFELTFDALASNSSAPGLGVNSLQVLMGLYLQCAGQYGAFIYIDPTDNFAADQSIGIGTGAQTDFTLTRALGGYNEPVSWAIGTPRITLSGVEQAQYHLAEDGSNGPHFVYKTIGVVPVGTKVTFSAYVKAAERSACRLRVPNGVTFPSLEVNLSTGAKAASFNPTDSVAAYVGNGWYLVSVSTVMAATASTGCYLYVESPYQVPSYAGAPGSGVYFSSPSYSLGASSPEFLIGLADVGATHAGPNWTIAQPNSLTFATAPGDGVTVAADVAYAFQCRFLDDQSDFENFMSGLWQVQSLKFRSVKP